MKKGNVQRVKPGVGRSVHLFIAPLLWTSIGIMLMIRGWAWLGTGIARLLVVPAIALGSLKSVFILDKTAARSILRIKQFDDPTCIGAVYSWKTWLLVALMMLFGVTARTVTDPGMVLGTLYVAIGWALLFSSRLGWITWWQWIRHD